MRKSRDRAWHRGDAVITATLGSFLWGGFVASQFRVPTKTSLVFSVVGAIVIGLLCNHAGLP